MQTDYVCDDPHIKERGKFKCICYGVASDYAADLSAQILDRGLNA